MGLYDIINGIDRRFINEELKSFIITYKEDNGKEQTSKVSGSSESDAKRRFMDSKEGRDIRVTSTIEDTEEALDESRMSRDSIDPYYLKLAAEEYLENDWDRSSMHIDKEGQWDEFYDEDTIAFTISSNREAQELLDYAEDKMDSGDDNSKYYDTEIHEDNSTSNLDGGLGQPKIPHAFQQNNPSKKDKEKERNNATRSTGYGIAPTTSDYIKRRNEIFNRAEKMIDRLDEVSYSDYRNDETASTKKKINTSIMEVNRRLYEVERMLTHAMRLKSESGADDVFWQSTKSRFSKISERMLRIGTKLREFNS